MLHLETVRFRVVSAHQQQLGDLALSCFSRDVSHQIDRQRDRLADACMWEPRRPGDYAVRQSCERLLGGIAMDSCHAAEVARVECLQQIECFGATYFTDDDAIRTVPQSRTEEVRNG